MKKIAIFGSTGSIGSSLLKIIKDDQKNFKIELLTANKNYKKLIKQVKFFNVKNVVVTDYNSFLIKFHPHMMDSLFAIAIVLVNLIISKVGFNP